MGFPISRFSQLSRIVRNPQNRNVFTQFKLICLVLNEQKHKQFTKLMTEDFNTLDRRTGHDMLFMTFCQPPSGWTSSVDFEEGTRRNLTAERMSDSDESVNYFLKRIDEDIAAPVIALTTDITSDKILLLDTNEDIFFDQLMELGRFCTNYDEPFGLDSPEFRRALQSLGDYKERTMKTSLAEELYEVFAVNQAFVGSKWDKDDAQQHVEQRQRDLKNKADRGEWDDVDEYHDYHNYVAAIKDKNTPKTRTVRGRSDGLKRFNVNSVCHYEISPDFVEHSIRIDMDSFVSKYGIVQDSNLYLNSMEAKSRRDLRAYNRELKEKDRMRDEYNLNRYDRDELMMDMDQFVHEMIDLYNILSCEMNCSVVQLMRQACDIDMPEFYCKYDPDITNELTMVLAGKRQERVYLNSYKPNANPKVWQAPELGKTINALYSLTQIKEKKRYFDRWENIIGRDFFNWVYVIVNLRNRAAHAEDISEVEFSEAYRSFRALIEYGFADIMDIKKTLRSNEARLLGR